MSIGRKSLRKKLMMLLMIVSCTVLSMVTLGFAISDWVDSRNAIFDRMRSQAGIIGNNSIGALTFHDADAAKRTLTTLEATEDIIGAVLFDRQKQHFAGYQRDNTALPLTPPTSEEGSLGGTLYVQQPVTLDNEVIGSIVLLSELGSWQQQQIHRMTIVMGLFLLSLLVAVLLSNAAQRLVTRPILNLARTAREVTDTRNYELRAEKISEDEIGSLADDFNEMLNQIQLRDNELRDTHAQLEDKVKERTSELLELAQQLEHQAFHDTLTGLANRATFDNNLQTAINFAQRNKKQIAVMFLDLDRFKSINDSLGHHVGDKLLIEMSKRLAGCLRSSDTLSRLGGDEFAILLPDSSPNAAADTAAKVIDTVKQPIHIEGYNLQVTTSIGISIYPNNGDSAATILKNADTAMYSSKDAGRNQLNFFSQEMTACAERRLLLENKLRHAISENLFTIQFQPKWDTCNNRLVGVEALIRWLDDDEGYISPDEFIPLAEDCGLIGTIDDWVCKNACLQIQSLFGSNQPNISLAVNVSPAHVIYKDIYKRVSTILDETGFPAQNLELEITETMIASEVERLYEDLNKIRSLGVEISIDDFGTGYSSLSRLKQLPLNTLKIDRSFVRDIGEDSGDEVIIRTIIDMAHNLNLKVVAEGVETDEQYTFIKQYNCDLVQGYLFSKPVPLNELALMLDSQVADSCRRTGS
ncbi:EAL domain-containing protein [Pontibacterium sp. N1Y112]|uniref:EAL domain-containing protein n=1 Tax=Pontibacterium sinense TaxID=2781979 RepID=A0A8J7K6M0_9GAMM|nr:EAL domain-containing protein [Pontibacterium sinense]MBE9397091.1 EAL domain-containing protein [Pontibacterium sinense]